jgi:hypothetical protein
MLAYHSANRFENLEPDRSAKTLSHAEGAIPGKAWLEEFSISLAIRCGVLGACYATESVDLSVAKGLLEMLRNEDAPA